MPSEVVAMIDVGGQPCGVAVAAGAAWVSDNESAELVKIDLETNQAVMRYPLDASPCEIAVGHGSLWVVTQSGVLDRVDPGTGRVEAAIPVGAASYEAVAAFGSVWVTNRNGGTLTRIDPAINQVADTIDLPQIQPGGIVEGDGALWVGNDTSGQTNLVRIDPDTLEVSELEAGGRPAFVATSPGRVWVANQTDGSVTVIDSATSSPVGAPIAAGTMPVNLAATPDGAEVWVPDDRGDTVTRIDAASAQAVERLAVGDGPAVVATTETDVWVTHFDDGTVWRIQRPG